jgi:Mrp family chromosome partitioning ATPase
VSHSSSAFIVRFDTATVETEAPHLHSRPIQAQENPAPSQANKPSQRKLAVSATAATSLPASKSMQFQVPVDSATAQPPALPTGLDHTTIVVSQSGFGGADSSLPPSAQLLPIAPIATQRPSHSHSNAEIPQLQANNGDQIGSSWAAASNNNSNGSDDLGAVDLADRIAAKNRGGDIFRLDRPSYATPVHEADLYADSDYSQPSEPLDSAVPQVQGVPTSSSNNSGSYSSSASADRSRPSENRQSSIAEHSVQHDQIRHKERSLRMARLRIFNPLWEVDRLEWPPICQELIESINSGSASVAQNLLSACQEGLQVLAVTSPQSGTGTSTVACCLAMLAGRNGLNVALVDGNTENPSLCYQTNLDLEVDWHEAVAKQLPLEEIAVHSVDDQVTLVPLLERLNAPELNERNMAAMLQELSQSFDMVIVDLGTMSSPRNMVNTLGELGVIHAVVAVLDKRNSSSDRTESCLRQIRQTGIASIGLVENFAA